jgi:GTP cyclohydrolase IB
MNLPDIQQSEPKIKIPIKQVGVENVMVPFLLETKDRNFNQLTAKVSMTTDLDANVKGISMSRLLLTLKEYLDLPLKHKLIRAILEQLQTNIGSKNSYMKFNFSFPRIKNSVISVNSFPLYYDCSFEAHLNNKNNFRFFQNVIVQYSSYCPCSAELCKDLEENSFQGFPHAQRSFADILIETVEPNYVWLEDIIDMVELSIKTLPYPIIKRIDEQEIAKIAAKNPLFVEDAIREISLKLSERNDIYDWGVKCSHEESIHTSEAIAINYKGLENGINSKFW